MVEFAKFTEQEEGVVTAIVERAIALFGQMGVHRTRLGVRMDISVVHAHTPLRLEELLNADDFEFSHDIGGIAKHLDRETGELGGCFVPRFAVSQEAPKELCLYCHRELPPDDFCSQPACLVAMRQARRRIVVGALKPEELKAWRVAGSRRPRA